MKCGLINKTDDTNTDMLTDSMRRKMKTIISTGPGRLHLFESAVAIRQEGIEMEVITGWVPKITAKKRKIIDMLGRLVGRNNLSDGMIKRTPPGLPIEKIKSCTLAEFYIQGLFKLSGFRILARAKAAVYGWTFFGKQSRKYIRDAAIFHVRSGAGAGEAIEKARKEGMKIIVDHSIAHPKEILRQLNKAGGPTKINRYLTTYPDDPFWTLVLEDCHKSDILLVNSFYVKDSFVREAFPAEKIRIVGLGINESFIGQKRNYSRTEKIKICFSGGFGLRKGANIIIKSIGMLIERGMPFSLDIIGSVMSDIVIPEWFKDDSRILFYGHLPQARMKEILSGCDIYIFPTYTEGAAQSVREAMGIGLPVITTFQSGAPIIHEENGIIIRDDDPEALTNAIVRLAESEEERKRIGTAACATIRDRYSWKAYARKVKNIYEEILCM